MYNSWEISREADAHVRPRWALHESPRFCSRETESTATTTHIFAALPIFFCIRENQQRCTLPVWLDTPGHLCSSHAGCDGWSPAHSLKKSQRSMYSLTDWELNTFRILKLLGGGGGGWGVGLSSGTCLVRPSTNKSSLTKGCQGFISMEMLLQKGLKKGLKQLKGNTRGTYQRQSGV